MLFLVFCLVKGDSPQQYYSSFTDQSNAIISQPMVLLAGNDIESVRFSSSLFFSCYILCVFFFFLVFILLQTTEKKNE
jgi:hypothetical protein